MKPSSTMLSSPAYAVLGSSARSVLRIALEEIGAAGGGAVQLSTIFFIEAGLSTTTVKTGVADLMALGFIRVSGAGTATRSFSLSEGWRQLSDQAEAARRIVEARAQAAAKAAQRSTRRRAAPAKAAAVDAGADRALPEGIRRAVWPQLAWQQGGAS